MLSITNYVLAIAGMAHDLSILVSKSYDIHVHAVMRISEMPQ